MNDVQKMLAVLGFVAAVLVQAVIVWDVAVLEGKLASVTVSDWLRGHPVAAAGVVSASLFLTLLLAIHIFTDHLP